MSKNISKGDNDSESYDQDGVNLFKSANLLNIINELKTNYNTYAEQLKVTAKLNREKFLALTDSGFTDAEALHILCNTKLFE